MLPLPVALQRRLLRAAVVEPSSSAVPALVIPVALESLRDVLLLLRPASEPVFEQKP